VKILRGVKDNLFFVFVAAAYAVMFVLKPAMGIASVKNSAYYIREMILIMPVIFVLTALLDLWVPKEKIMKYLGRKREEGERFLPWCWAAYRQGRSTRPSRCASCSIKKALRCGTWDHSERVGRDQGSDALNELKFLGFRFMAVRWVLTVIAILLFSWITARFVGDLPRAEEAPAGPSVNQPPASGVRCAPKAIRSCSRCETKSFSKYAGGSVDQEKLMRAAEVCPVKAITAADER
jgi:uncharacterized membrane protein YraQ (UPF0718 family)